MLTRDQYKKIKAMNREELDRYLDAIYAQGYNNGVIAMSATFTDRIDKGIRNTPGVGEKRYQEIMKNITEELNRVEGGEADEENKGES